MRPSVWNIKRITVKTTILLAWITSLVTLTSCYNRPRAPETLRILFTSGTQGNFTPCGCVGGPRGGMERRATAIREARESAPGPVILLDTGNWSTGSTTDLERLKAEYVTRAMAQIGYDAVNVGQMDARRPRLGVLTYNSETCPLTSGGYTYEDEETGERLFSFPTSIVVSRDGFRIGIVGSHLQDYLNAEDFGYENEPTVTGLELMQLINRVQTEEGAGMVILISDLSASWQQARMAASLFSLSSIVIAGQSAPAEFAEERSGADIIHPVVVPRAASWGRALGILDLDLSPTGGITRYRLDYVDLTEDIEKDPAFEEMTDEYLAEIDTPPAGVPEVRQAGYVGSNACQDCHGGQYVSWSESPHAEAWQTLEATGRLRESACVPCHVTGYPDTDFLPERLVPYEFRGVGCESCHGPGDVHIRYQRWTIYGELTGETRGEDLTDPIVLTPDEETCTNCHVPPYDEGWLYDLKLDRIRHE